MILSQFVERAVGQAPVAVMAYAALERALEATPIDALFEAEKIEAEELAGRMHA